MSTTPDEKMKLREYERNRASLKLGGTDCWMRTQKSSPAELQGQFWGKEKKPTANTKATCDRSLRI